jgi:hypothetical protein
MIQISLLLDPRNAYSRLPIFVSLTIKMEKRCVVEFREKPVNTGKTGQQPDNNEI